MDRIVEGVEGGARHDLEVGAGGVDVDDDVGAREDLVVDEARDALGDGASGIAGEDPVHVLAIVRRLAHVGLEGRHIEHGDDD